MSEHASRWRMWMENPCWDELEDLIDSIINESIADEDSITTDNLNIAVIAENRGIRKGLNKLRRQIDDILEKK